MRSILTALVTVLVIFLSPQISKPADIFVNPIRLFFDVKQKTTIIKVKNNSDQKLSLQIDAYSWIQDEEANDQYQPTQDVILFPKMLSLEGGEERIIRVGINSPPMTKEKTYRIFLEELPQPLQVEGNVLRTILKIGVPMFIAPVKSEVAGEIEKIQCSKCSLACTVKNKGNVHFVIQAVKVRGLDASGVSVFQTETESRYLLEGHSRTFSFGIPKEDCLKMSALTIDVVTDKFTLSKSLDAIHDMCSP